MNDDLAEHFWTFGNEAPFKEFLQRFVTFHDDQKIQTHCDLEDIVRYTIACCLYSNEKGVPIYKSTWDRFLAKFGPMNKCAENVAKNLFDE